MIAMNREHGNGNIDIRIFVVDMAESTEFGQRSRVDMSSLLLTLQTLLSRH